MPDHSAYIEDIAKYTTDVSASAVAGIVKHLGIALSGRDSSLVSCSDQSELDRVRESWCKKKLALTDDDATLNATISAVCQEMSADLSKHRVTFYYLVAEKHGKLADLS